MSRNFMYGCLCLETVLNNEVVENESCVHNLSSKLHVGCNGWPEEKTSQILDTFTISVGHGGWHGLD